MRKDCNRYELLAQNNDGIILVGVVGPQHRQYLCVGACMLMNGLPYNINSTNLDDDPYALRIVVECKELFYRILPELDDSLVEKLLPGCSSLNQVREAILQRCKQVEQNAIEQATDNAILDHLRALARHRIRHRPHSRRHAVACTVLSAFSGRFPVP
ncbi:hypothetical protein ZIOFF_024273 [Zingiber officinale]|uniref:Uncharacterized protein n=1 Tax=Zingiber officinale TaxID=94328 RepID=A0A8J5H082_ZINOF|nr:hypothetical protein ZIOFF_024273 [Zingiber officinale]